MWDKTYSDYIKDEPNIKFPIESGNGKCEMHEIYGWGNSLHCPQRKKKGLFYTLMELFFGYGRDK
jgi:hypothetical protein